MAPTRLDLLDTPHHDGSPVFVPDPVVRPGRRLSVFAQVPAAAGVTHAHARTVVDGEPTYVEGVLDRQDRTTRWFRFTLPVATRQVHYRFLFRTAAGPFWLNAAGTSRSDLTDLNDFVRTDAEPAPGWADGAICYEIFPDRFSRSGRVDLPTPEWAIESAWDDPVIAREARSQRQLYRGDLWGVADRLDHVAELGANLIYLTPVFPGRSSHRYDASTFDRIDPLLGGEAALAALTGEAHRRGIRVIGDLTLNHSGSAHEWFTLARADPTGPAAGRYYHRADTGDFAAFANVPELPKLNYGSSELRADLIDGPDSVVARWLRPPSSLDGWRIDVAQSAGVHGLDDYNAEIAATVRATMAAANPDALLLAEHQYDATASLQGYGWHGTMNYAGFTRPVWSWLSTHSLEESFWGTPGPVPRYEARDMVDVMRAFGATVPWSATTHNLNLLDSHDTARLRTVAGRSGQLLGAALMFTLPGIPMVFAGDEIGAEGDHLETSRIPFPWSRSGWDVETLATYQSLAALRTAHAALRTGGLRWLHADADTVVFERRHPDATLLVQVNRRETHSALTAPSTLTPVTDSPALTEGDVLPSRAGYHVWQTP